MKKIEDLLCLGLETSCDETAASVVQGARKVLSSLVYSQIGSHQSFGGVIPELAAREHLRHVDQLARAALKDAGVSLADIDLIAVTQGPGLIGALLVGVSYAKGLSWSADLPLVPVNHVHAHVHGALLGLAKPLDEIFPALSLVVSGGHTNLYYMEDPTHFELMAESLDDACGECFDKVAKCLGLGYPGGPLIENLAEGGDPSAFNMPRMIAERDRLAFSYSGLKTFMLHTLQALGNKPSPTELKNLAAAFQNAAFSPLARKIKRAAELRPKARGILIAGGVAANRKLRSLLTEALSIPCFYPELTFCGDNAAMIAALASAQYSKDQSFYTHSGRWDFDAYSRYGADQV